MNAPGGMVGMNAAAGGPVGAPMVNNVAARQQQSAQDQERLNTYIYDYLCKSEHFDLARQFLNKCQVKTTTNRPSPGRMNGVDDMDADSKDGMHKRPDDLPYPEIPPHHSENAFLYDWWCQFWDIFGTARRKTGANGSNSESYLNHNMSQTKMRQMHQAQMLQRTDHNMMMRQQFNGAMPNGMNNMAKQVLNRNSAPNLQMQQKMMQNQTQMQRDGSMGDNRAQSPNSVEAMGSPSKRPRTDGGNFNGQPGPAGRGQMLNQQIGNMSGAGGPNGGMLLHNGLSNDVNQQQMAGFAGSALNAQQKALDGMTSNGGPLSESQMDFLNQQQRLVQNAAAGASGGNHALQDYQMQLMLLEQQNKKRLLMARQEQDNINHGPSGSAPGGQITFTPTAMSPSGSRAGPSPNPNEQMKRVAGTPKMVQGVVPGSPMPEIQNRGSPAPGFEGSGPQAGARQQFFNGQMGANPGMMMAQQPPSSHPGFNAQMANVTPQMMEQMRMAGRMSNGQPWQGGPQMMQPGQQQQQMGTPQQRTTTNMAPPPAPSQEQQRTQPSSPAQPAAPPTPSQAPKAAPKGKKEGAAAKKKAVPKKNTAAATPVADTSDPPQTPTPATPITPMHAQSFSKNGQAANGQAQVQAPTQTMDPSGPPFGELQDPGPFNLDFAVDGSTDVLENFDFDSFLHNDPDNTFPAFDLMNFSVGDGTDAPDGSS